MFACLPTQFSVSQNRRQTQYWTRIYIVLHISYVMNASVALSLDSIPVSFYVRSRLILWYLRQALYIDQEYICIWWTSFSLFVSSVLHIVWLYSCLLLLYLVDLSQIVVDNQATLQRKRIFLYCLQISSSKHSIRQNGVCSQWQKEFRLDFVLYQMKFQIKSWRMARQRNWPSHW